MIRKLALLSVLALGTTACNDNNPTTVGDASPSTLDADGDAGSVNIDVADPDAAADSGAPACTDNADCAGGELCNEGVCAPFCFDAEDCPASAPVCDRDNNACVVCLADADCGDGETCTDHVCEAGCSSNTDCAGGELCREGLCEPFCTSDADCTDGQSCDDNVCVDASQDCDSNDDCPGGTSCVEGACLPFGTECEGEVSECTGNETGRRCEDSNWTPFECGTAEVCEEGECLPALGGDCAPTGGRYCDDANIIICADDGTITATIACDDACEDGDCVDLPCTDADNFCVDDRIIAMCDPDLDVFFQEECHPQQQCIEGACAFEDGENVCGGDEILDALPGDACGDCGLHTCDPDDGNALACDDPGLNTCGGCGPIDVELGAECGECGTWGCAEDGSVICDDPGLNGCGWCGDLEEELGTECGDCGVWACEPGGFAVPRGVKCEDPGANRCGGCTDLPTFPGALCEDPNEVYVCDGDDGLRCQRNLADGCFTAIECNIYASQFGIVDPLSLSCDDEVGCFLKGNCSPDGIPTSYDPFGSACVGGSTCTVVPVVDWQLCTGCTVGDDSTCRNGEVCEEILFGLTTVCTDPLALFP